MSRKDFGKIAIVGTGVLSVIFGLFKMVTQSLATNLSNVAVGLTLVGVFITVGWMIFDVYDSYQRAENKREKVSAVIRIITAYGFWLKVLLGVAIFVLAVVLFYTAVFGHLWAIPLLSGLVNALIVSPFLWIIFWGIGLALNKRGVFEVEEVRGEVAHRAANEH